MIELPKDNIESERIILKHWEDSDLDDLYEFGKVSGVGEAAGWHHFNSFNDARDFLTMFKNLNTVFCVYVKKDKKAIGTLDFIVDKDFKDGKTMCIGYSLSKKYWGNGFMKEAIEASIPFFKSKGMDCLSANIYENNKNSIRLVEKMNFKYYNTFGDKDAFDKDIKSKKYIKDI